jgi:hypothetical protein
METLNEIVEGVIIDIASEGMGTTMGFILMWGMFFGGTYAVFHEFMLLLSSTI